jgi:ketosteroid isomerase-like protein
MAAENIELVKGIFSAYRGGASAEIRKVLPEAVREICDPEIELIEAPERLDARTYHGHEGVLEAFNRWLEQWEEYDMEAETFEDHGDDVFVVAHETGRGDRSGASVSTPIYIIVTVRRGKILRYRGFYDEAAARAALVA